MLRAVAQPITELIYFDGLLILSSFQASNFHPILRPHRPVKNLKVIVEE